MSKVHLFLTAIFALGTIGSGYAAATVNRYSVNQQILNSYQDQLYQEVKNQEQFVEKLQNEMASTDTVHLQSDVSRYSNAVSMLDVKRILVNNFVGTPALQSAVVRDLLLKILKQELITPGDLAHLQSVVNSEKAKMQPPPSAEPTTPTTPSGN